MTDLQPAPPTTSNHPPTPNEALAANRHSPQYWDRFYTLHRSEFLKWTFKHYHLMPDEAIDVYQDAIVILYENAVGGKLDHLQCTVKTYFFGIAKNLISTYLKKKIRAKERYESLAEQHYELETTAERENDWMDYSLEVMAGAVKKLSGRGQEILHLFYFEKMSLRDITQVLSYKSEAVVKTTKLRHMKLLREMMKPEAQYS